MQVKSRQHLIAPVMLNESQFAKDLLHSLWLKRGQDMPSLLETTLAWIKSDQVNHEVQKKIDEFRFPIWMICGRYVADMFIMYMLG